MAKIATKPKDTTEQHAFGAEISRVLDLMIHALYTNRDIFLRELISNASDACDKLRYQSQTNQDLLENQPELTIHLSFNVAAGTLTIEDTGIGMDRDDLMNQLGTIAKSGTSEFFEKLTGDDKRDANLIGQFGVGFYSAFMAADRVRVESRKAGAQESWCWESDGKGSYELSPVTKQTRGTRITLTLKEDAKDYLDRHRLQHIVTTYSDHIGFPITLTDADGTTHRLNDGAAIWTRNKSDVSEEQHQEFYRHLAHSPEKPWAVLHSKAEGVVEYTSLLYVPGIKPFDLFRPERRTRVKLYVKRVFIADEGVELIPPYLRFLRGVVDSADLPLNISRETLQQSPVLEKIRDSVTGRVLSELKKRAEKDITDYTTFWNHFGAVLKEGLCESTAPRDKILEACRFASTQGEALTSLAEYKSRMKENQQAIYYIVGDTAASLASSPQIEGFVKRGIEVLLLTDHVDDFWTNVTLKFGELPFRSVVKSGADLDAFPFEGEPEKQPEDSKEIATLIAAMKTLYADAVRDVRTTRKLSQTPVCLAVGEGDMDMRMERFLLEHKQLPKRAAKIVEINPTHPLIGALAARVAAQGAQEDTIRDALWLLYDQALIAEGESVPDAGMFARRLAKLMEKGIGY